MALTSMNKGAAKLELFRLSHRAPDGSVSLTKFALSQKLGVHPARVSRLLNSHDAPGRLLQGKLAALMKGSQFEILPSDWDEPASADDVEEIRRLHAEVISRPPPVFASTGTG